MDPPTLTARALPALRSRLRAAPAAWAFLAAGSAATGLYFAVSGHAQAVLYVAIGFASVCAIYAGTVRNLSPADRLPWHLFAVGLLAEVAGDAVYDLYTLRGQTPPTVGVADVFYLAGYPLLFAGVLLLLRRLGGQTSRAAILDALVIFSGVALIQWVFFIEPVSHHQFANLGDELVAMAYPTMDVLLLVALAQLLLGPGSRNRSYRILVASVALWVVPDEVYALEGSSYALGDWLDALWLLSYVMWGVAALDPSVARLPIADRRRLPRLTTARLALLALALLTGPAILVAETAGGDRRHSYAIAIMSSLTALLVLARLGGLVRAVERARRDERSARRDAEQAQQLLSYQNQQLVELDRMKDEFVSSVSHELRTPLTSISGYVELLAEDEQDPERRGYLGIVGRNAQRVLALVSDLLFAARLQGGRLELRREAVDLNVLAAQAVESARPRADAAPVRLTLDAAPVRPVLAEAPRISQVFDNLISNAIKFTPAGGSVVVRLAERNGTIVFEVSDTGIGIPPAERERLFERFFRSQTALERQIQGTGLGLYISKAIVDAHGGRIAVSGAEGEGTTFIVELPLDATR